MDSRGYIYVLLMGGSALIILLWFAVLMEAPAVLQITGTAAATICLLIAGTLLAAKRLRQSRWIEEISTPYAPIAAAALLLLGCQIAIFGELIGKNGLHSKLDRMNAAPCFAIAVYLLLCPIISRRFRKE